MKIILRWMVIPLVRWEIVITKFIYDWSDVEYQWSLESKITRGKK